jgi:hypothetical protein
MFARSRNAAVLAIAMTCWLAPGTAGAASTASFDDPVGDSIYFAADLGTTTVTVGDDDTVTLDTRIVPRPPAYWGGCGYIVGVFPYQTCVPANMNVTWYLDFASGAGSVADSGADAKVTAIPSKGQTFWESARWDAANGRFAAGAKPAGVEDSAGAGWKLNLADLGIPKPATARIWVVSLYKSYNGVGTLLNYSDVAGPGSVSIGDVAAAGAVVDPSCTRATGRVNKLQRQIRAAKRRAAKGSRSARRRLARLRSQRKRALKSMKVRCGPPVKGTPPTSAPPGCRLVTKTVLKQEGIGIYAKWVLRPEVVVECSK